MILTGPSIASAVESGDIRIEPFNFGQVQPNSYDFRLGSEILTYANEVLDVREEQPVICNSIPPSGLLLRPDLIYLASTVEIIGSTRYVPIIRARSSVARLGLFVHVTADLIDIGSFGQLTLQLHAVQPVRIYADMLIGQVTFWGVEGKIKLYNGKYQGSFGPQASKIHLDDVEVPSLLPSATVKSTSRDR